MPLIKHFIIYTCILTNHIPCTKAWGKDGHEMIANIAYNRLSTQTRRIVNQILNVTDSEDVTSESNDEVINTPLGEVADWADSVKYHEHWSMPLHYINVKDEQCPHGCHWSFEKNYTHSLKTNTAAPPPPKEEDHCRFVYSRDCVHDKCVAGAIANYTSRLDRFRSPPGSHLRSGTSVGSSSDANDIRESLMFATHFFGDIHQPLHVSRSSDHGGNKIDVTIQLKGHKSGSQSNLHSVWDSGIIKHYIQEAFHGSRNDFENYLVDLIDTVYADDVDSWLKCSDGRDLLCSSSWAQESLIDGLRWAYLGANGEELVDGDSISDDYYITRLFVVEKRLVMAGVRLAAALEIVFSNVDEDEMSSIVLRSGQSRVNSFA